MGSAYYKRSRGAWYVRVQDVHGQWRNLRGGRTRADALAFLDAWQAEVQAERARIEQPEVPTVAAWAERWREQRRRKGVRNLRTETAYLRHHVLPAFGRQAVDQVTREDVRDWVLVLREREGMERHDLAPRTIRHIYDIARKLFADACRRGLLAENPCDLAADELPRKVDKDPEQRATAYFSRAEVELLLVEPEIPAWRRMAYGVLFLTGVRFGELAGLRWRHIDESFQPLSKLVVAYSRSGRTKGEATRGLPVHPTLAGMLAEWRLQGWAAMVGRAPRAEDFIVPSNRGTMKTRTPMRDGMLADLERLGLRRRRMHDARRTFITLALADGARKDVIEMLTHPGRAGMVDLYNSPQWATLCEAVLCLDIRRHREKRAVASGGSGPVENSRGSGNQEPGPQGGPGASSRGGGASVLTGKVLSSPMGTGSNPAPPTLSHPAQRPEITPVSRIPAGSRETREPGREPRAVDNPPAGPVDNSLDGSWAAILRELHELDLEPVVPEDSDG